MATRLTRDTVAEEVRSAVSKGGPKTRCVLPPLEALTALAPHAEGYQPKHNTP